MLRIAGSPSRSRSSFFQAARQDQRETDTVEQRLESDLIMGQSHGGQADLPSTGQRCRAGQLAGVVPADGLDADLEHYLLVGGKASEALAHDCCSAGCTTRLLLARDL